MNAASELRVRWLGLVLLVLLVVATLMVHRPSHPTPVGTPRVTASDVDLAWTRRLVDDAFRGLSREIGMLFGRLRAIAALAEYRAARAEHARRAEWCGVRHEYPRPLRPIRISKACLDNPLAKDCM